MTTVTKGVEATVKKYSICYDFGCRLFVPHAELYDLFICYQYGEKIVINLDQSKLKKLVIHVLFRLFVPHAELYDLFICYQYGEKIVINLDQNKLKKLVIHVLFSKETLI